MEVTGSAAFNEAMLKLKREFPEAWKIRDVVIDEVERLQERLAFFRPKCAQCDAPLDVHPYQCKIYGLCDKCGGDVGAGAIGDQGSTDTTTIDVEPGGVADLSGVKTRYVQLRVKVTTEGATTSARITDGEGNPVTFSPITPAHFVNVGPCCPGCGHFGCAVNSEGCAAGQCACEALKRPDPATWKPSGEVDAKAKELIAGLKDGPPLTFDGEFQMEPSKTVITAKLSDVKVVTTPIPPGVCPFCDSRWHTSDACPEIPF